MTFCSAFACASPRPVVLPYHVVRGWHEMGCRMLWESCGDQDSGSCLPEALARRCCSRELRRWVLDCRRAWAWRRLAAGKVPGAPVAVAAEGMRSSFSSLSSSMRSLLEAIHVMDIVMPGERFSPAVTEHDQTCKKEHFLYLRSHAFAIL